MRNMYPSFQRFFSTVINYLQFLLTTLFFTFLNTKRKKEKGEVVSQSIIYLVLSNKVC